MIPHSWIQTNGVLQPRTRLCGCARGLPPLSTLLTLVVLLAVVGCERTAPTPGPATKRAPATAVGSDQTTNSETLDSQQAGFDAAAIETDSSRATSAAERSSAEGSSKAGVTGQLPGGNSSTAARGPERTAVPPATSSAATKPKAKLPPPKRDDAGGNKSWLNTNQLPYEYWETQYLNAQRIGVTHYRIEKASSDLLKLTASTSLEVQRAGQIMRQRVVVATHERMDGMLVSFSESTSGDGVQEMQVQGAVASGELKLRSTAGASISDTTLDLPDSTWGCMGIHQLLMRKPMFSGERRVANVLLPQIHQVARVTLTAGIEEETTSPDGPVQRLLPIEALMQLKSEEIRVRMWTNAQGQILKSIWPEGLNLSSYRVSRDVAERAQAQGQVDVFSATSIKLEIPLVDAENAEHIVYLVEYLVEAKQVDPQRLFSQETNQTLRVKSPLSAELTVWRPQIEGPAPPDATQSRPTPECLASSPLIKSDDPLIVSMAARLAGQEQGPSAVALTLTKAVHREIRKKNFSRAFDSAQDVARSLEGDCTEHAVLLAALLRSRSIPARIASGMIATNNDQGSAFVYHMWTEAWIGDRWIPLDATLGTVAGCGHIKFLETPLADANPYTALLPVLASLGQLSISVVEKNPE